MPVAGRNCDTLNMRYSPEITDTLCELFRIAATTPREVADVHLWFHANCDAVSIYVHPGGYQQDVPHSLALTVYPAWTFTPGETDHEPTAILAQLRAYLATLSEPQMATDADGHWIAKMKERMSQ